MSKFCRYLADGQPASAVAVGDHLVDLRHVADAFGLLVPAGLGQLIRSEELTAISRLLGTVHNGRSAEASLAAEHGIPLASTTLLPPLADPPKIWCIGLNYRDHAADLDEQSPDEPASFMRPAVTIVGPGAAIRLPPQSNRVTGEAELAVVIGRRCKNVSRAEAPSVIAGFMPAIDMTAEDILRRNPRFLTRSKSFDSFLSLGPFIVTPDEIGGPDAVLDIRVSTVLNGVVRRSNTGRHMMHDVYDLLSFHSQVFTWEAGDVLLTGTPGAVQIAAGDVIGSDVSGVGRLENPVM